MPKAVPGITYTKDEKSPVIDSPTSPYIIPYYKDESFLNNYESYEKYVKAIERVVRTNDRYSKYIFYLKNEIKLNHCMVLKNVDDNDCDIEMHHGPVFTLYDVCAIVLEYFILKKWKISTTRVADVVLDEHLKNRVQVIMVSATVHEEIHNGEIFINYKQAWGDLAAFTKKYWDAISPEYREQLNRYIDRSLIHDSNDFGILTLNPELTRKKKEV
jgi:hypothetical protein